MNGEGDTFAKLYKRKLASNVRRASCLMRVVVTPFLLRLLFECTHRGREERLLWPWLAPQSVIPLGMGKLYTE